MSQHDYVLANQAGAAFRADANNALGAVVSQNSGATEPTTTFAYMLWADTTSGFLKQRNAVNSDWIIVCKLSNWAVASVLSQSGKTFTTAGTSTAFTITTDVLLPALVTGEEWDVTFNAAAGATPTLARDGLTAKNLKYRDSNGTKRAITSSQVPSGWRSKVVYDGTDYVVREVAPGSAIALFSAFRTSSDQSISTSTFTKVQINSEQVDTNGDFDSTTNYRFTPSIPGYYLIGGAIDWSSSSSDGFAIAAIYKNGASYKRGNVITASVTPSTGVSSIVDLTTPGDYVELYGTKTGTTAVIAFGSDLTYFYGYLVRPA